EALDLSCVGEVRCLGLIVGVELVADRASRRRFPAGMEVGGRVRREAQARGVLVRNRDDVINLAPPYVVSEPEIERIAAVLRESIASATQQTAP
ncbi:MAG: aspartate aminotransferase family protein, partial [Acidisphaera sp.]|nr:aspartate aminotransferase family protein [Acidisphaera sp.]